MRVIARNLALVTGSRVLDGAVRFFTVPIILGHFGKTDFGLIALAFSFHVFLTIADFGISVNAVRRISELFLQQRFDEIARLAHSATFFYTLVGVVNLLVVLAVGAFGQDWFQLDERRAHAFFWMMLALGASSAITWAASIYRQILHATSQVGWDESINLVSSLLTVGVVALTVLLDLGVAVYFVLVLLPPLVPTALRVRRAQRTIAGLRPGLSADWSRFRPLVGTSLWLFSMSLSELLANSLRPIILAQQSGLDSVGDFRIIQQVAGFATLLLGGFMSVLYPAVARLDAADDHERLAAALSKGSRLLLWAHLGALIPLAFVAEPMLRLYLGRSFSGLSGPLAVWLLTLVAYHNTVISSLILARGRIGWLSLSSACSAALTLAAAYVLAPRFGVAAMVASYAVYMAIQLAVVYLVALPLAGGGSGVALARQVFPAPLFAAMVATGTAVALAQALGTPTWVAGPFFVPLFVLIAMTVGHVRADLQALRGRTA